MLPVVTFSWVDFAGGAIAAIASAFGAMRAQRLDPVDDLTDRLRSPARRAVWTVAHPVRAIRRVVRRG